MTPSENLDKLTSTFEKDRAFFDALLLSPACVESRKTLSKIVVVHRWMHLYFLDFQEALTNAIAERFPVELNIPANFWTTSLTAQIARDSGLICYMCVRGLPCEASPSVRRCLENIGMLAHFWADPQKAKFLDKHESTEFQLAFIRDSDRAKQQELKAAGISKRFAELRALGKPASQLYSMVSKYGIHGGTPENLIGKSLAPTATACAFANRPTPTDEALKNDLMFCEKGQELTLAEFAYLVATYGKKTKQVHEGGNVLLDLCGLKPAPEPYLENLRTDLLNQLLADTVSSN